MGFIGELRTALRRPSLFEPAGGSFWRDSYLAEHILQAHLDPDTDDASRRRTTIIRSARWIAGMLPANARVLDLGCGPGLYCEEFAREGLHPSGVDYSEHAIEYARRSARIQRLSIDYEAADYREFPIDRGFGVITLIYGGFGVLSNDERDGLLRRVRAALAPTGLFIFDVFTERYLDRSKPRVYTRLRNGFWSPKPHLVIEQKFDYGGEDVHLDRYLVVDLNGRITTYNLWKHFYSTGSISTLLYEAGYSIEGIYGDLTGSPSVEGDSWIGVVARSR